MNVAKYYRERGGGVAVRRVKFSGACTPQVGISDLDKHMAQQGYTRRRPSSIKSHSHRHQQPGYRPPSEQQRRRARQLLRGDRRS